MNRALILAAATLVSTEASAGQATCSNPGLPIGAAAASELVPARLVIGLTTSILPIRGTELLPQPPGVVRYDSRLDFVETRLAAEYTLSTRLALGFALPYRVVDIDVTYRDPATGMEVFMPGIHARDERLTGVGDGALHGHLAHELGGVRLHARGGISLPIGKTLDHDPFELGALGQPHEHVQFGTGTFVPFLAVEAQRPLLDRRVTASVWGLVHASLYENELGYRAGTRLSAGVTASTSVGRWTFGLATELHAETAETWSGVVHADEGNAGRRDLYVGGSIAFHPSDDFALTLDLKIPVVSHVTGSQLDYRGVLGLGVVTTFDLAPRPLYRGLDHGVAGPPGSAPPLLPIAGKLVVYDLWATWCPPCRELDGKLAALARRFPDRLAIRKLDVVDPDSVAWKQLLAPGQFELPHVRVVRPDGSIALERSAAPDELVRAIEALLAP